MPKRRAIPSDGAPFFMGLARARTMSSILMAGLFWFSLSSNNKSHYRMSLGHEFCLARAALPRKLALDESSDPLCAGS
ncbi:hypothetical protein EMIT0P176_140031 [Pseudomonas sp. IT-P176]